MNVDSPSSPSLLSRRKARIRELKREIALSPRDPSPRLDLAALYHEVGRKNLAAEHALRASQCPRFDPDFDYAARLGDDFVVVPHAGGELIELRSEHLDSMWCDPAELQAYLIAHAGKEEEEVDVNAIPASYSPVPDQKLLARLWALCDGAGEEDAKHGKLRLCPGKDRAKLLSMDAGEFYHFIPGPSS